MATPVASGAAVREEDSPKVARVTKPAAPARERLAALDAFRRMTIAGMLLVNHPGTWAALSPPPEPAPGDGWTPRDLTSPFFVFIVGVTPPLSLSGRARGGEPSGA